MTTSSHAPANTQDRYIDIGNITMRYRVAGRGDPVILLHGIGGFLEYWDANIQALAQGQQVYALDMLGFGRSTKPPASYTLAFLAQGVQAFAHALQLERVSLVGLSLGGGVALQFARMFPHRVRKLVLVASAGLGRRIGLSLRLATLPILGELFTRPSFAATARAYRSIVMDSRCIPDAWLDTAGQMVLESGAQRTFLSALRASANVLGVRPRAFEPIVHDLPRITAPTLVVWGKQDPLIPAAYAHVAAQGLPHARLHLFDRCGHLPQLEYVDAFNELVHIFLLRETS
jgi:4,5:9,10-diseco-3-hydroxy-5,9,17-trioxoandrosta-1(10),2-diene-4-oate hydrolase